MNEEQEIFSTENAEHMRKLAAILRTFGIIPDFLDLATQCKKEANGTVPLSHLMQFVSAFAVQHKDEMQKPVLQELGDLQIRRGKADSRGWVGLLYGPAKCGKSTLGAQAPTPLFVDVEDGLHQINCDSVGCNSWLDFTKILSHFGAQNQYKTLVIDTVDFLEKRLWELCCEQNKWRNITAPGFGTGYKEAHDHWVKILEICKAIAKQYGKNFLFVGHTQIKEATSSDSEKFERHTINLNAGIAEHFFAQMDVIMYAHFDTYITETKNGDRKALSNGERKLALGAIPNIVCGNRFGLEGKYEMHKSIFDKFR